MKGERRLEKDRKQDEETRTRWPLRHPILGVLLEQTLSGVSLLISR